MHRGSCCQIHCHCYSTMAPAITTTPTTNDEHRATGAEIRAYGHIAADACDGFIKVETRRLVDPGRAHAYLIHLIHPIVPVHTYVYMYTVQYIPTNHHHHLQMQSSIQLSERRASDPITTSNPPWSQYHPQKVAPLLAKKR